MLANDSTRVQQRALTLVHPIGADALEGLKKYLDDLGDDVRRQTAMPLARLTTVHYARWVVLDAEAGSGALLAFESNHDGDTSRFLQSLIATARPAIDRIYGACRGYPGAAATSVMVLAFLEAGTIPTAAFFVAHPGKTVESILAEAALRAKLES